MVVQKSIRKNFIYNSILTVSNVLIPLVTFPYVSRVLGANGIGSVEFSISFINYFVMLASLGIPTYGIRACAKVRDNTEKLSKVVEELLLIGLFMTIVCYIIFFICLFFVPQLSSNKPLFLITSLNLLLNTVSMNWLYSALEEYKFITFRTIVFRLIALALTFLLVKSEKDTDVYALILVLSTSGSFVINAIHSRKFIYYKKFPKYDLLKHIPAVMTFFASTVAISVYTNLDSVMLGFMVGGIQVGYYSSALKVRSAVATLSVALGNVLLPRLSYWVEKGDFNNFKKYIELSVNFVSLITIPLVLFFVVFAKQTILCLSGPEFSGAITTLQVLIPAVFFAALSGITGTQTLVPIGEEKKLLVSLVVGAVADFILNLLLISQLKSTGAALSTLLAEILVLTIQYIYIKKYGIKIKLFGYIVKPLCASLITLLIVNFIRGFLVLSGFFELLVLGIIFGLSYIAFLILLREKFVLNLLKAAFG